MVKKIFFGMRRAFVLSASLLLFSTSSPKTPPSLVVVISIDQLPMDLLERYQAQWKGGFKTFLNQGYVYTHAYQSHAFTETGPGHAAIMSGRYPRHTHIPVNVWLTKDGKRLNCTEDENVVVLNALPGRKGASNVWFRGTVLGDWLTASSPQSQVISISGKDRGSIFTGGTSPSVYWYEAGFGFTTSSSYRQELPLWMNKANAELRSALFTQYADFPILANVPTWIEQDTHDHPKDEKSYQLSASYIGESSLMTGLPRAIGSSGVVHPADPLIVSKIRSTPLYDEFALWFSQKAIEEEKLGQDQHPDLLFIGLSATDYIGHSFGNDGPEMRDQLFRLDASLQSFMDWAKMQAPDVCFVLTSDHGASDFPERLQDQGVPAQRLDPKTWIKALSDLLLSTFSVLPGYRGALPSDALWTSGGTPDALTIPPLFLLSRGLSKQKVYAFLLPLIKSSPFVVDAFSSEDLETFKPPSSKDPRSFSMKHRFYLSYVPGRSGDLYVVFRPRTLWGTGGAEHGTPYDYDRHVPLIFLGPWKAKQQKMPVEIIDLAPTLASILKIKPTEKLDGKVLSLQ